MASRRARISIQPFKHHAHVTADYASQTWQTLDSAIQHIFQRNQSHLSFEELYRAAYNLVLHHYGGVLYDGLQRALIAETARVRARLAAYVRGGGEGGGGNNGGEPASDSEAVLLREARDEWASFRVSLRTICDIFMYADRSYVKSSNRMPVYELGVSIYRDAVVRSAELRAPLLDALLEAVRRERVGDVVERPLLTSAVAMYRDLRVYESDFEPPFLEATRAFYRAESREHLQLSAAWDYLHMAARRLRDERELVCECLEPRSTQLPLGEVVQQELIARHYEMLADMENSGFLPMVRARRYDDLHTMYRLFGHASDARRHLCDQLRPYVKSEADALLRDTALTQQPVRWMERVVELRNAFRELLQRSFETDAAFVRAVHEAYEASLNAFPRAQEYLSLYLDKLLRSSGAVASSAAAGDTRSDGDGGGGRLTPASADDLETQLDDAMAIFRLLRDKDVFERYYKQHLSKRLLSRSSNTAASSGSASAGDDSADQLFLLKLKAECGAVYTSKLESMFNDLRISETLSAEVAAAVPPLYARVLTTGAWPIEQQPPACNVPAALQAQAERFRQFYLERHSGRRLLWHMDMGTAELRALFDDGRRHEMIVSTYQMCVLLLFNDADTLTREQIASAVGVASADELTRTLQSLACGRHRVLVKEPRGRDINAGDRFTFNGAFRSERYRFKVGVVAASHRESEEQRAATADCIERDRRPEMSACIVRVMKSRRVLEHNQLVAEATRQLQWRFTPSVAELKREIETLIERDYLAREHGDRTTYRYIA